MKIGVTYAESNFEKYLNWLEHFKVDYIILDHNSKEEGYRNFKECSGLILSGGVDVYPEIYCDWDTKETKGTYLPGRDGFEMKLIEEAEKRKIPVLGICRGIQIINVYYRGNLIFDLEEIRNTNHRKISKDIQRFHKINILKDTLLYEIVKSDSVTVNSSHHQAAERIGEGLMVNAKSDDGIVEGIEYSDKTGKPFMIAVQWHPERMPFDDPVSENILKKFLSECVEKKP
ncbi:MAG TPA: gamma-glutamyl-gamma-aminobutyrate hydrolase family protein [Ignavibacteria bacterium]|nr:gamma-glutamyl-gamma-aminobutyrate hydrolase family protein [Ignavibacteria bacterium]HRJ99185.1 gamma-glutamyl-gamma-aminobutyrate hydrolase family protein [Ignavibacteria bacterium]